MASLVSASTTKVTAFLEAPALLRWCSLGLLFLFCVAVELKLNGSSVGMWSNLLMEKSAPQGLLYSSPKRIRVDEWGVWTPAALSQARQHPAFPIENPNLGAARSPLLMSVPVAYYTTFFRPQFFGFFLFDFERGFSFYWCSKVFGLLLASGWFLRRIGIRSYALILFGAIWIYFSSYVQWWFSSPAMLPEMIASWAMTVGCAVQFLRPFHRWKGLAALAGFIYFGINFILCLYPPYQIPLVWLAIAVLIGLGFEERKRNPGLRPLPAFAWVLAGFLAIALILLPFWFDIRETLQLVAQTVYPGARRSHGGDLSLVNLFSGLVGFFEIEQIHPEIYDNICEASNFYPLWVPVALAVVWSHMRRRVRIEPLPAALGFLLIAFSLFCVVRLPSSLLSATLISFTTEKRTLLAIGLANILFCCVFFDRYRSPIFSRRTGITLGVALALGIAGLMVTLHLQDPKFFLEEMHFSLTIAINGVILILFFSERWRKLLPAMLAPLLIFSNGGINPIMRGLSPLVDSEAVREVSRLQAADPAGKWIVYNSRYFAQLVKAAGVPIFNGTKTIPDLPLLRQLDAQPAEHDYIYNRYANIGCELPRKNDPAGTSASLVYPDYYIWFFPPDHPVLQRAGYRYALFPSAWPGANSYGFSLVEKITRGDLWIYRKKTAAALARPRPEFPERLARF